MEMPGILQVRVSRTDVCRAPQDDASVAHELIFGETVRIRGNAAGWIEVTTVRGGYEGFVREADLAEHVPSTHRVASRAAVVYGEASFKKPLSCEPLYFNSELTIEEAVDVRGGNMCKVRGSGWVHADQLRRIDEFGTDFVEEALKLEGIPYGWEKRGLLYDCSSLVQAALIACGIESPRDVKDQVRELGEEVPFASDLSDLRRGDLVFWTEQQGSHVVIMIDRTNCFHATIEGPYRRALIQPLADVAANQLKEDDGPVTFVRRFPDYSSRRHRV